MVTQQKKPQGRWLFFAHVILVKLLGNFLPVNFLTAKKVTDPDLATIAHTGKLVKYLGAIFAPSPLQ